MTRQSYVYLMANKWNTVIYTGVTSDLRKRIYQHKQELVDGFSKKYKIHKLVYFEVFDDIKNAILREKQIKGGSRGKKLTLIKGMNPKFEDLYQNIL